MSSLSAVPQVLSDKTRELVANAKVFVVGAGGIGCEILKNLALSGFTDIEIVSNKKFNHSRMLKKRFCRLI